MLQERFAFVTQLPNFNKEGHCHHLPGYIHHTRPPLPSGYIRIANLKPAKTSQKKGVSAARRPTTSFTPSPLLHMQSVF